MKKTCIIFLTLLLAAGCAKNSPGRFEPLRYFTAGFTLTHGDYTIEGEIACHSYEDIRLTFTHPQALSYLTLQITSQTYYADVAGVSDEIEACDLPAAAPVQLLVCALRQTLFEPQSFTVDNDAFIAETTVNGQTAVCRFTADGAIRSVCCEALGVSITFSE